MALTPVPCSCGGGGGDPVEVTTCCSPSIATSGLCLEDGTAVVLVLRSACAECGGDAGGPEVAGWIDPATGTFTPGSPPAGAGPCTSGCVDVTTVQLCDLTPGGCVPFLRHLVRDCDGAVTGHVDTTLDGVTTYDLDGTAGDCTACDAGCVDTICVQRCDDTDGDGAADATYSELWCVRADGSAELVLIYQADPSVPYTPTSPVECTYGCPETETITLCDASGPFLRRYTFLHGSASFEDVELDGQTPHIVNGTVGVCASGSGNGTACAGTICVQRCDDTTGDGQPDTTYQELWCVADDGTTSLLLTYAGDPSTPYDPAAPVDCTYGTTGTTDLVLCDASGPFIRRVTVLGGVPDVEDYELDGVTLHLVVGVVGVCTGEASSPCAEQTTPAATLGLCLPGGVPIAVVLTRDCDGNVTQDGWINLTTGTYTAGPPPAGAQACGDSRAFALSGILCDVDPATGDVLRLVLVEYEYNPDGSLAGVRLVDAATGATYLLQGELRSCPDGSGAAQPEQDLIVLCDDNGPFLRDYRRDVTTGAVTGHTDYLLDGTAIYDPVGQVVVCRPEPECQQHLLEEPRWDDTDGDGLGDLCFLELIAVDSCTGALTTVGTYLPDLSGPYEPVSPTTECPVEGAPAARGVQARRVQLAAGESWDLSPHPLVQSVTATAHGGDAEIATADGVTTLYASESVTWSVVRPDDAALVGPLTITAQTAPVTITYTRGVQL